MASASTYTSKTEFLQCRLDTINECLWRPWNDKENERVPLAPKAIAVLHAVAGEGSTPALIALALMAQIAYEEGDSERVGSLLRELMRNPIELIPIESLIRAYPLIARVHVSRGDHSRALQLLVEGQKLGEDLGSARLMCVCLREQIYWLLAREQSADAKECLTHLGRLQTNEACGRRSPINVDYALAGAWVAVACHDLSNGIDVLRQLHREALLHGDICASVRLGLCLVDALHTMSRRSEATSILLDLLRIGMGAGLCQSVIDGGSGVRTLILDLYRNGCTGNDELRQFLGQMASRMERCSQVSLPQCGVVPPEERILTPRETHVLRLIGGGLSNKRIARDLRIAPETVKSHTKHIFAKLGTRTRAESITRAVKLCIL